MPEEMSPEDAEALSKQQCIFCSIVSGQVPAKKIYEDQYFVGVLDINPATAGHILVISREHHMIMPQMHDDEVRELGSAVQNLSRSVIKGLEAQGTTIFVANGAVAGQRAPHFMLHVIPRTENDGLGITFVQQKLKETEVEHLRVKLANAMNKLHGLPETEQMKKEMPKKEAVKKKITKQTEDNVGLDDIAKLLTGK